MFDSREGRDGLLFWGLLFLAFVALVWGFAVVEKTWAS